MIINIFKDNFDRFMIISFVVIIIFFAVLVYANSFESNIVELKTLNEGKNIVNFSRQYYASELISSNNKIDYISYRDLESNKTFGYVNIYGGIGKNFVIEPGINYEIYLKNE